MDDLNLAHHVKHCIGGGRAAYISARIRARAGCITSGSTSSASKRTIMVVVVAAASDFRSSARVFASEKRDSRSQRICERIGEQIPGRSMSWRQRLTIPLSRACWKLRLFG